MSILVRMCRWVCPRSRARRGLHFLKGGWQARALILTYHRVVPKAGRDPFDIQTTTAQFAAHLECLATGCKVVGLDDLVGQLQRGRLEHRRQAAITFDDGYLDNHRHAAPLLRRHGLPATVYLTAGYVGSGRPFWWDEVDQVVTRHLGPELHVGPPIDRTYRLAGPPDRAAAVGDLCGRLRRLPAAEREALLETLSPGGRPRAAEDDRPMTWDEARELPALGVAVGAHTCGHPSLGGLSAAEALREVRGSKEVIEDRLQTAVEHFSYPHDDADYHARQVSAVSRDAAAGAGFTSAASIVTGVNAAGQNLLALRRLTVRNWEREEFGRQVRQAFHYGY